MYVSNTKVEYEKLMAACNHFFSSKYFGKLGYFSVKKKQFPKSLLQIVLSPNSDTSDCLFMIPLNEQSKHNFGLYKMYLHVL